MAPGPSWAPARGAERPLREALLHHRLTQGPVELGPSQPSRHRHHSWDDAGYSRSVSGPSTPTPRGLGSRLGHGRRSGVSVGGIGSEDGDGEPRPPSPLRSAPGSAQGRAPLGRAAAPRLTYRLLPWRPPGSRVSRTAHTPAVPALLGQPASRPGTAEVPRGNGQRKERTRDCCMILLL